MELRQKILLTILIGFLPIIILFSIVGFYYFEQDVTKFELERLDGIGASIHAHIYDNIERNYERLQGITSRTQLRESLDAYNTNFSTEHQQKIEKIITDGKNSINEFKEIMIFDPQGNLAASTNYDVDPKIFSNSEVFEKGLIRNYLDIDMGLNNEPTLFLSGPMYLDGKLIGVTIILSEPNSITDVTSDYISFGETGESFMAKKTTSGDAIFITPLRFDNDAQLKKTIPFTSYEIPITQALLKNEDSFENSIDYRGKEVLASTRYIVDTDWGLVVKIDKDEAFESLNTLKSITIFSILISIGFAVGASIILSQKITKPIEELQLATHSISKGDYDIKIKQSKDELGALLHDFKKMGTSLKKSRKQLRDLREVEESKENFLSMVTHELRTPLTPILGWCEALKEPKILGSLNEKQIGAIDSIEVCAIRLKKLIEDVLDVQKLDIGKFKIRTKEFPIHELIKNIKTEFEIIAQEKNIDFTIQCPNNFNLDSDRERIKQVITNLLNNAKDFVPEKNAKISLTVKEDVDQIIFSLSDNGIGINKEQQQELFKKFYQIDTSVTREHQGSGLGLSICKGIIETLGGKIWVESQKGKGTTFYFTIPHKKEVYNK